jgi:MFS family permease
MTCDAAALAKLLSSFSLGYTSTQIAGGLLTDKIGSKIVGFAAVLGAGLMAGGVYWQDDIAMISALTLVMGICQGPLFPASMNHLGKWIPAAERGWGCTMLDSGTTVGMLLNNLLSGWLAVQIGWRAVFLAYGTLAVAFCGAWHLLCADSPATCSYITEEEANFLRNSIPTAAANAGAKASGAAKEGAGDSEREDEADCGGISKLALLTNRGVLAIYLAHMAFNTEVRTPASTFPTTLPATPAFASF